MKIGIVGLPNVGKSTLFKALTKKEIDIQNYPFCTIEPNVGVVIVPDDRLEKLTTLSHSAKTVPAIMEFFDIAGLVKGASAGEGLGNKFLTHIRETDAIAHMVRIFDDENIIHVESAVDPLRDIETITLELILADLETVKKRAANVERDTKRGDKIAIMEHAVLTRLISWLEAGNTAAKFLADEKETEFIRNLHLISSKPVIYILNKKAGGKNIDDLSDPRWTRLESFLEAQKDLFVKLDANLEMEVGAFERKEREEYRNASGLKPEENLDTLIRTGYDLLGLITYFTTGEDETRAWTVKKNSTAPQAGRAIHSDFEEKFIKADIISYDDFVKTGSMEEYMKKRRYAVVLLDVLLMYKKMNGEEAMAVFPAGGMVTILNGSESSSCSQRGAYYVEGLTLRVKFLIPASHLVLINFKKRIIPKERAIHALCLL